jgi:hypothetical protein
MSKNKRERLTKRQVQKRLDELLESGLCISEMDAAELDHMMWSQPSLYVVFAEKIYNRK